MFRQLINGQSKTITSAAVIIAVTSIISRVFGFLRDRILAGEFGAGEVLDIYYAAFRWPDLVYSLLVFGALSAGFIPVFVKYLKDSKEPEVSVEAWRLANGVLNILVVALLIIGGIMVLIAPFLTKLIAPGFTAEAQHSTVALTRLMFLSPILLGISAVFGGILQSLRRFFLYSLAPIVYNIGIIIGALFLVPFFNVYGLALGVVLGAFLHLAIQLPGVFNVGFRFKLIFPWRDKGIREIVRLMIPRSLALMVSHLNLLVITIIASSLAVGSIAVFNFANNLQSFPLGVFGISLAIAAFPTLSSLAARGEMDKFQQNFSSTVRQILFFIIPLSVFFLVLRAQIVRVILGTGRFDWQDTILTADSLGLFVLSLFAQALISLLVRAFYALHNAKTPLLIGLISVIINLVASLYFSRIYGVAGLAMAFSLASIINMILLWVALKIKLGSLDEINIIWSIYKISVASFIMGLGIQIMKYIVEPYSGTETFLGIFTQGFIAGLVGIILFVGVSLLLKSQEMKVFLKSLGRHLLKVKEPVDIGGGREI